MSRFETIIACLAFSACTCVMAADRKDPSIRDEDISAAVLSVEYFTRADGLYEYVYSLQSPPRNNGIILDLEIELACAQAFEPVNLPFPSAAEGYDFPPQGVATHTPTAVFGDFGSAFTYGISSNGSASWGLYLRPGETRGGLRLISPAAPGLRTYTLLPAMDNDASWNYPVSPDPELPWVDDFTVSGTIAAPGCPGVTRSPGP